jgi:hypothetical protein
MYVYIYIYKYIYTYIHVYVIYAAIRAYAWENEGQLLFVLRVASVCTIQSQAGVRGKRREEREGRSEQA